MRVGVVLALAVAIAAPAAAGHFWQREEYVASGVQWVVGLRWEPIEGLSIGGASFDPVGVLPALLVLNDESGGPAYLTVCQDWDDDERCESSEPSIHGCGTSLSFEGADPPFASDRPTSVFIQSGPLCGSATHGNLTLHYGHLG